MFVFIEEGIPSSINNISRSNQEEFFDSSNLDYYDLKGNKLDKANKGLNIIRSKDGMFRKKIIKRE